LTINAALKFRAESSFIRSFFTFDFIRHLQKLYKYNDLIGNNVLPVRVMQSYVCAINKNQKTKNRKLRRTENKVKWGENNQTEMYI
jgi:hypothetical protein